MPTDALPKVGAEAPAFTLPSTSGDQVTLASFRGKQNVLLAFFPLAFTSTCSTELHEFSEDLEQFENAGTVVLPVCCDSVPTLKAFKQQGKMRIDLLSDFMRAMSRDYGTLIEAKNHSSRAYILIDRSGVVRWTWEEAELGHRRENGELLAQIAALG
ncbi:MAG: redoxin domain-containing protein [Gemmatimonadales bacterium]